LPIYCDPNAPNARVGALSGIIGGHVRAVDNLAVAARILVEDPTEMLIVIGPGAFIDDALAFTAGLRLERPPTGVILLRDKIDVWLLNQALQCGVREVVALGDDWALHTACERSRMVSARMLGGSTAPPPPAERGPEGEIITVFAPKGGVGKTTLATNIGVVLAGNGHHVCVVDLDIAAGDIAISVQLDPVRTLVDAVSMAGHLDTTGAASLLTQYRPGLQMLLAPVTPSDAEKVNAALVSELLSVLRTMFHYVVVDTASYLSEHMLAAMDLSARLVLIATPDVPSLKNLRVTQDTLDLLSFPRANRYIVLNRADSNVGLSPDDVLRVLRAPIAAHIPSSRAVPLSINKGTPITLSNRDHPVSKAIARFADEHLLSAPPAGRRGPASGPPDGPGAPGAAGDGGSAGLLARRRDRRKTTA
jgi:Flp pilus assembly CpaE family ATPase